MINFSEKTVNQLDETQKHLRFIGNSIPRNFTTWVSWRCSDAQKCAIFLQQKFLQ